MKGSNNGKRRRNSKAPTINAFTNRILLGGTPSMDTRHQRYTTMFVGGQLVLGRWKGGGYTRVRGALSSGDNDAQA